MLPYVYTPRPGEWIKVDHEAVTGHCLIGTYEGTGSYTVPVRIRPDEVPGVAAGIAAAMHETAGLPAPVILDRPEPRDLLAPGAGNGRSWVEVEPSPPARSGRGSTEPGTSGVTLSTRATTIRLIRDEPLRIAVALVDAMREAGDGPDPAEVEELAAVLSADGMRHVNDERELARAALRWFAGKQQRGETP